MALSGLDIYKLLPKTNCKECGYATCLAFAMALAQKKVSLDKCPHVTAQARLALESSSQPPIKLVTIGTGESKLELGNETVMFRHEQKFYHPTGIGFLVEDTLSQDELKNRLSKINDLKFERVGQIIKVDLVALKNSSQDKAKFISMVKTAVEATKLNIILISSNADALKEACTIVKDRRPLIMAGSKDVFDSLVTIAKENNLPLVVEGQSLEEIAVSTEKAKSQGIEEMVLYIKEDVLSKKFQKFTLARRSALKKNTRPLGYPLIAFTTQEEPERELEEAISYVTRYANIVILKNIDKDFVFPLLVVRQDIYTDPQKPVQVEPKVYEIGHVTKESPVIATTNFSITYFTVAGEVEGSKVPTYIISCDAEGMSVLTAWAAEKFTAEKIADTLKKCGIEGMVSHKKVVIPGYVAVLSGKLEELSGWTVEVGPREASGLPAFLKGWK
ncbi:MAG: acetyl-CoA decarbonylase/synthase complex subunit gamma [Candidatus Omnitrophica bacterium]|nr:acetyl-CoA decarbonylase/synthase complex subunit gamma [Candidatus Omnitrophota bacterium]